MQNSSMTAKELRSLSRKQGNADVKEFMKLVENKGMTVEQSRRAPLAAIRSQFELSKYAELLPGYAPFTPYRKGWRGAYTITHGTPSGYSQGCRLECCRSAWTAYRRQARVKKRAELAGNFTNKYLDGSRSA